MLNERKIRQMIKEMGMDRLANPKKFAEFDNWTKLSYPPKQSSKLTYFIEIASTTTTEMDQRGKDGELGGNPQ